MKSAIGIFGFAVVAAAIILVALAMYSKAAEPLTDLESPLTRSHDISH